jgi:hypothetical protein
MPSLEEMASFRGICLRLWYSIPGTLKNRKPRPGNIALSGSRKSSVLPLIPRLKALVINPSFLRMQESRRQWIPAFAGMTLLQ